MHCDFPKGCKTPARIHKTPLKSQVITSCNLEEQQSQTAPPAFVGFKALKPLLSGPCWSEQVGRGRNLCFRAVRHVKGKERKKNLPLYEGSWVNAAYGHEPQPLAGLE